MISEEPKEAAAPKMESFLSHPTHDALEGYLLLNTSDPADVVVIEQHLLWCGHCRAACDVIDEHLRNLRQALKEITGRTE